MGKLTRDDAYQGPEEVHGVQQPPHRIFTHLFDFEVDQIHPLYGITQTEDMHYLSQWFGPPVQELEESATIEEAIERCQAHYDSLSSGGMTPGGLSSGWGVPFSTLDIRPARFRMGGNPPGACSSKHTA